MNLLDGLFGSESISKIFSDEARLQRMLDFEAALARAEVRAGVIPASAAQVIAAQCRVENLNLAELSRAAGDAGNLAIPLVKQLTEAVQSQSKEAAHYVHWGATSQDAIDTGLMLQVRDALAVLLPMLDRLCESLAELAERHRATPMVARTWMQQAIPTVFGLQVAGWLDGMNRHRLRFSRLHESGVALQFGGAAGSLAALGDGGLAVSQALAEELHLPLPDLPWHTQRDRIAEIVSALAMCVGSLGKIARDVALQSQTEIGELSEPEKSGRGGSSTMPHKRNPVNSAVILAAAERIPLLAATVLSAMQQEYERGLGNWLAEWETLPEIFRLSGGALERALVIIEGLVVHADRMLQNLELTRGLIFAEPVTMALAAYIGKPEAHTLVEEASRKALNEHKHLLEVLRQESRVTSHLGARELERLFDPGAYQGEASRFIDRVLSSYRASVKLATTI